MAKMRTERAPKHDGSPATGVTSERDEKVLLWRVNQVNNHIGEWVIPHHVEE